MTRHQRLQRTMRSPARQKKIRKRDRDLERELIRHMISLYEHDPRLIPPAWIRDEMLAMQVVRPRDLVVVTSI